MSFKEQRHFVHELFLDKLWSPFIMSKFSIAIGILRLEVMRWYIFIHKKFAVDIVYHLELV